MRNIFSKLALIAALTLAITFTFSCSDDKGNNNDPSGDNNKCNNITDCKKKQIGSQTWMAENLNIDVGDGSKCYKNKPANCAKYGRLYTWAAAMALDTSCNTSSCASKINTPHQGICPSGWHIPSDDDWEELVNLAGGESNAGTKLKAIDGWESYSGIPFGTDSLGFSALPGGIGGSDFLNVGIEGNWWSTNESNNIKASFIRMSSKDLFAWRNEIYKKDMLSVRCVQN